MLIEMVIQTKSTTERKRIQAKTVLMINQIKLKLSLLETLYLNGINGKGLLKNHGVKIKMSLKVEVTQSCGKLTN